MPSPKSVLSWFYCRAENILAAMIGAMFVAFILQIVFRYVLGLSIGWTHEVSVILWLWLIFFGAAFVVRSDEEIRFEVLYHAVRLRIRRVMTLFHALVVVIAFVIAFSPTLDYVLFMKVERTAYLNIRFDYLFSIYIIFVIVMVVRHLIITWQAVRGPSKMTDAASSAEHER